MLQIQACGVTFPGDGVLFEVRVFLPVSRCVNQRHADIRQPIKDSIRRSAYWIPVAICPIEIPLQTDREEESRDKEQEIDKHGQREGARRGSGRLNEGPLASNTDHSLASIM